MACVGKDTGGRCACVDDASRRRSVPVVPPGSLKAGVVTTPGGLSIRPPVKGEKFSFTLFLRLVAPDLEKLLGERLVNQPAQMSKVLADLADALRREGKSIVAGEDSIFERMKGVRWWDFQPEALKRS